MDMDYKLSNELRCRTWMFIMDLLLEIISHQRHAMSEEQSKFVFKAAGGTIGRNQQNDWMIDDPERLISGHHVSIHFENNQYIIIDTSTNGLYVNNEQYALGDNAHSILNGDIFLLGQYSIQATLIATQSAPVFSSSVSQRLPQEVGTSFQNRMHLQTSVSNETSVPLFPQEMNHHVDPLSQFKDVSIPGRLMEHDILSEPDSINSVLDPISSTQSYFELPNAIPENWQNNQVKNSGSNQDNYTSVNPSQSVVHNILEKTDDKNVIGSFEDFKKDFHSSDNIKKESSCYKKSNKVTGVMGVQSLSISDASSQKKLPLNQSPDNFERQQDTISILLTTMGISSDDISPEQLPEVIENIALLAKNSMSGLMKMMISRTHLKNEFRLSMTTIQSNENNPFKFCINDEQLIYYLLVKPMPGYLNAEQAVKESFEELQAHQLGVMAGMKSAVNSLLDKFSPKKLIKRSRVKSLGLSSKKSQYWDSFTDAYEEIKDEDDAFTIPFSNEFSKAYERQVDDIRQAKVNV